MSCCSSESAEETTCCGGRSSRKVDWLLWGSLIVVFSAYLVHWFFAEAIEDYERLSHFTAGSFELMNLMWWGVIAGIVAVGVMHQVPKEVVSKLLGRPGSVQGIFRSVIAGLFLDLCNHGILLVATKLYERGASLGQVFAFLIASPWNSISLTLILISLIGFPLTLLFILCSGLIAIVTGLLVDRLLVKPPPSEDQGGAELSWKQAGRMVSEAMPSRKVWFQVILRDGWSEARMILRWVFFGVVLAALIRALLDPATFQEWLGPSLLGLLLTLLAATVIEVCSEGSTPIAADLVNRAYAPGNGFTFLMAGAATDYTEIMALKEVTRKWKLALLLPALTVPQVLVIAAILNYFNPS
ncbi:MAG: permease [Verrucomicrobiota bacterium]